MGEPDAGDNSDWEGSAAATDQKPIAELKPKSRCSCGRSEHHERERDADAAGSHTSMSTSPTGPIGSSGRCRRLTSSSDGRRERTASNRIRRTPSSRSSSRRHGARGHGDRDQEAMSDERQPHLHHQCPRRNCSRQGRADETVHRPVRAPVVTVSVCGVRRRERRRTRGRSEPKKQKELPWQIQQTLPSSTSSRR